MPLHPEILSKRLRNEYNNIRRKVKHNVKVSDPEFRKFPVKIEVSLKGVPGPVLHGDTVDWGYNHKFLIEITKNYPSQRPLVSWKTPIFHPNICPPEEKYEQHKGHVCTHILNDWKFGYNLVYLIEAIESLLINPNTKSPLPTPTCTFANEYFNRYDYKPPAILRKRPEIVIKEEIKAEDREKKPEKTTLRKLAIRRAKGEITREEYKKLKGELFS
ncbi:MAG: ubiquitin-conjugating enzyme E2 [Candidatus Methanofastidiosia archaeon]